MTNAGTCKQWSNTGTSWGGNVCGKPVKGEFNGEPMCGRHLVGAQKRAESIAALEAEWARKREANSLAAEAVVSLAEVGVTAELWARGERSGVWISSDQVAALVARLTNR